jgi:hypothetical protein
MIQSKSYFRFCTSKVLGEWRRENTEDGRVRTEGIGD